MKIIVTRNRKSFLFVLMTHSKVIKYIRYQNLCRKPYEVKEYTAQKMKLSIKGTLMQI